MLITGSNYPSPKNQNIGIKIIPSNNIYPKRPNINFIKQDYYSPTFFELFYY